ncbi:MAG: outer membrane protein assembly factor BamD [Prevotellaceae bacterium]|jgi:outer membrane protein assembly factor BamD|nr:outer membrane protein assembly factor BamD [Prevotellaceae bacterium]
MNKRFLFLLILPLLSNCVGQYEALLNGPDAELKYAKAMEYFNAKKYSRSKELFDRILLIYRGTPRDDSVQYHLGLSHYYFGDYIEAEAVFDQFTQIFPRSPFTEKARFLRIDCLNDMTFRWELDQMPSHKAISVINEFLYDYPTSEYSAKCKEIRNDLNERLERKSFESARLYYKIEDYRAAAFALKNVLRDNPDNRYREDIMYYIVASNYQYAANSYAFRQRERFLVVIDEYYNFISEFPESKYSNELAGMFRRAQRATSRSNVQSPPVE